MKFTGITTGLLVMGLAAAAPANTAREVGAVAETSTYQCYWGYCKRSGQGKEVEEREVDAVAETSTYQCYWGYCKRSLDEIARDIAAVAETSTYQCYWGYCKRSD